MGGGSKELALPPPGRRGSNGMHLDKGRGGGGGGPGATKAEQEHIMTDLYILHTYMRACMQIPAALLHRHHW